MGKFLIGVVGLVAGLVIGAFVGLNFGGGAMMGAGVATGLSAGICSTVQAAQDEGLVDPWASGSGSRQGSERCGGDGLDTAG